MQELGYGKFCSLPFAFLAGVASSNCDSEHPDPGDFEQNEVPAWPGLPSNQWTCVEKLWSATLTIAVLVVLFCFSLTLPTFLRLGLSRLAALLALSLLSGLAALLTFLLHIVSHKAFLLKKREIFHAFEICR
jgi:hypothetical protein